MISKYRSKIGLEIVIPIAFVFITIIVEMVSERIWIGLLLILAVSAFITHLLVNTYYLISSDDNSVIIRSGFFYNQTIAIDSIRKISESNVILSSPAASIDRLEIIYNKFDSILISPKDKSGFIKAIKELNPEIKVKLKHIS